MFIKLLFQDPRTFSAILLIVVLSVCVHEFMHAYIALKNGDPTAADHGHLTLNPFKQMGLWSLITFCLIGIAWGQVPVNRANLRSRKARLAVDFAGVAANLILSAIFLVLLVLVCKIASNEEFAQGILFFGASINLVLFVINLFPVPGFDGWNVLTEFRKPQVSSELVNGIFFIMVVILFFGINYIQTAADALITFLAYFLLELC
ncbi:MAG: site-2 protease family protein [Lentisphaeria bacterium]|nr:site-2 protease family protein [Lentisphaeria bacterium]